MDKYFKSLPSGYTYNYFYEFSQGFVTFRRLATTPNNEATSVGLINRTPAIKNRIPMEFFGKTDTKTLRMIDLKLPTNAGRKLSK